MSGSLILLRDLRGPPFQDQLEAAKDQFLGRDVFAGGAASEPPIDKVWNVDARSHIFILRYSWLK
jgi:hypothetical protein